MIELKCLCKALYANIPCAWRDCVEIAMIKYHLQDLKDRLLDWCGLIQTERDRRAAKLEEVQVRRFMLQSPIFYAT